MIPEVEEFIINQFENLCREDRKINEKKIKEYLEEYPFLANYDDGLYFCWVAQEDVSIELLELFIKQGLKLSESSLEFMRKNGNPNVKRALGLYGT